MLKRRFSVKIPFKILQKTLIVIFLSGLFFSLGYYYGNQGFRTTINQFPKVTISRETPFDKQDLDFNTFWRVWDTLQVKYYDKEKLIDSELVYGAISGMVASVGDPYTVFLPPSENKVVQEDLQGNFEGVGIQIGFKGSQLVVIAPLSSSPAEAAGIRAGDFIIGIKDEQRDIEINTVGITLPEAVKAIRGSANTKVTLFISRENEDEILEVEIVRAKINVPSIVTTYVGSSEEPESSERKNIAHVKILKFSGETLSEWEETVVELLKNPELESIVIDVRNNPGGYFQGAVELASDFLEIGDVVAIEEDGHGAREEFRVEKLGRLRNFDAVILINEGSASASEIFAGALRDNEEISLIGETSFGKGTIQEPQQINGNAGLHITIARWLTPSEFWVDGVGLDPDVKIEDNSETEIDEQLLEAVKLLQ